MSDFRIYYDVQNNNKQIGFTYNKLNILVSYLCTMYILIFEIEVSKNYHLFALVTSKNKSTVFNLLFIN